MAVKDASYAPPRDLFKREGAKEEIKLSLCRYIGSLFMTYLLFENEDEMIMVDQHAAHERINYERLKGRFEKHLLGCPGIFKSGIF